MTWPDSDCEAIWIKLAISGLKPLYTTSMYCRPDTNVEALEQWENSLSKITCNGSLPNLLITGDFNAPCIVWDDDFGYHLSLVPSYGTAVNQKIIDIINDLSLTQMVKEPTRGRIILDLVFTSNPNLVQSVQVISGMSDHDALITDVNMRPAVNRKPPRKAFNFKKGNMEAVKDELREHYYH